MLGEIKPKGKEPNRIANMD